MPDEDHNLHLSYIYFDLMQGSDWDIQMIIIMKQADEQITMSHY